MKGRMKKINNDRLGNLTRDNINFPKWLTPEIVHTALYVHNAPTKEDIVKRVDYMAKQIGDEAMQYVMALLVLPTLIENTKDTQQYKDWTDNRFKSLN